FTSFLFCFCKSVTFASVLILVFNILSDFLEEFISCKCLVKMPISVSEGNKSTSSSNRTRSSSVKKPTGRTYIRGPRGGCYYINSNGNKTYVDRSFCN